MSLSKKLDFPFESALAILAALRMIPRLAFLCWCALLLGAAVPLAIAWARIIPADEPEEKLSHDRFATILLILVTLSFLLQVPGLSFPALERWLAAAIPQPWPQRVIFWGEVFFAVVPGPAAMYAILRPNPLRAPLIASGILMPALWLLGPYFAARWAAP